MNVNHYQRRPGPTNYSIEREFDAVRAGMPNYVKCRVIECPCLSRRVLPRIINIVAIARQWADVHHITGDVHYLALGLPQKKTLLTINDCVSLNRLNGWRRAAVKLLWYCLPVQHSALVTTISKYSKKELLQHVSCSMDKIRVVHAALDNKFISSPYVFNARNPVVLQVGTGKNKNLERTAMALKGIRCRLQIIGKITEQQERFLVKCGVEYSAIHSITDAELIQKFRQCDMLVFASTYEGFGMPIIEAQATGRPVITSTVCSMPEVAGGASCLVDPFDFVKIREGILRVIEDKTYRESLVEAGLKNCKHFYPEVIAAQYVALYDEIYSR